MMKIAEMKQVVDLLDKEWNLGKAEANTNSSICAWIYLLEFLKEAKKIIFHKEDNKIVGVCGYADERKKSFNFRRLFCSIALFVLYNQKSIKNSVAFNEYTNNYSYVPKHLENYFDGEISILIVDKNYRGKGIGENLMQKVFELAKKDKLKNLRAETTESCSYNFYDKCGFVKIYEKNIENKEKGKLGNKKYEKAFVYEKRID